VPVLSVRNASGLAFSDVSFDIHAGEIVGMAGLVGSGRTEIIRAILGADPLFSGDIRLKGTPGPLPLAACGAEGRHRLHQRGAAHLRLLRPRASAST
jgi:ABC-type sugar transport system ATPase subunit